MPDTSTRIRPHIKAPRELVYLELFNADAVATWMVPSGHFVEFISSELSPAANQSGWRMAQDKLATLVESGGKT